MPTVLRSGPYRVYFYSHESNEPPHVPIDRDQTSFTFRLSSISLASSLESRAPKVRDIERLIEDHVDDLLKEWKAIHGESG